MQIARGDNKRANAPPRRTNSTSDDKTEEAKENTNEPAGVKGPAGKTPDEIAPEGKKKSGEKDVSRLHYDNTDGCNLYLALYRQIARDKTVSAPCS